MSFSSFLLTLLSFQSSLLGLQRWSNTPANSHELSLQPANEALHHVFLSCQWHCIESITMTHCLRKFPFRHQKVIDHLSRSFLVLGLSLSPVLSVLCLHAFTPSRPWVCHELLPCTLAHTFNSVSNTLYQFLFLIDICCLRTPFRSYFPRNLS